MQAAVPFIRDQGSGPGVLCLHSNASTSAREASAGVYGGGLRFACIGP
jgi:hypothetical protein